jgi:septin 7
MAAAINGLLAQSRDSRSESATKDPVVSINELEDMSINRSSLQESLHRHQRTHPVVQYRSMLDVDETPSLKPLAPAESIVVQYQSAIDGIVQKLKHSTTSSDWADILCFYTATNGVAAPSAPTRASPAPNGKAVSPSEEVPQSISSTDPKVAAQQASDMRNIVRRKLTGYVGFANLPNQWHRKSVRKGFNFNVMVVGMYRLYFHPHTANKF